MYMCVLLYIVFIIYKLFMKYLSVMHRILLNIVDTFINKFNYWLLLASLYIILIKYLLVIHWILLNIWTKLHIIPDVFII